MRRLNNGSAVGYGISFDVSSLSEPCQTIKVRLMESFITTGKDMPISRLTSKGQTTIPKEIRERLNLKPGDRIRYTIDAEDRVVIEPFHNDLASLAGIFYDPNRKSISIEEMKETMEKAVADHVMGRE